MIRNGLFGLGGALSAPNPYRSPSLTRQSTLAPVLARGGPLAPRRKYIWGAYEFEVCDHSEDWNHVAGVYIFAAPGGLLSEWWALYVGRTDALATRMPGHERWQEARRRGATHVHVYPEPVALARVMVEHRLIKGLQPPMNTQGK